MKSHQEEWTTESKRKKSKKDKHFLNIAREIKKKQTMEHKGDGDTSFDGCTWKMTRGIRNQMKNRDHIDYSVVKIVVIMAERFLFMPLGLVRLITFRLSAWVT